jgi:hypothetical protein
VTTSSAAEHLVGASCSFLNRWLVLSQDKPIHLMPLACPNCQSDNLQTFRMVFETGTSSTESVSSGTAIGLTGGGGIGIGVGSSKSSGTTMSLLAQKVAPPVKKKVALAWLITVLAALFVVSGLGTKEWGMVMFFAIVGTITGYIAVTRSKWNQHQFPALMRAWERSWLCHKCGNTFVHENTAAAVA